MTTRRWILLLVCLAAALAAAWLLVRPPAGGTVQVWQDDVLVLELDARREGTYTVEFEGRRNVIQTGGGQAQVVHADCPDQVCVLRGAMNETRSDPIVCLPNRLIVQWSGGGDIDAVTGR